MTPDPQDPPAKKALAVLVDHPGILTLDPVARQTREQSISQLSSFSSAWQYISSNPIGSASAWATVGLHGWTFSQEFLRSIREPLTQALAAVGSHRQAASTASSATGQAKIGFDARYGVAVDSVEYHPHTSELSASVTNAAARYLGIYVEFIDAAGQLVEPTGWASRLPADAAALESATTKYVGMAMPGEQIAGVPIASDAAQLVVSVPSHAAAVRLMFSGPCTGPIDPVVNAAGLALTAVLAHAVPLVLDGAGITSDQAVWYSDLVSKQVIIDEVLVAVAADVSSLGADAEAACASLASLVPAWLNGKQLPLLNKELATRVSKTAVRDAVPVLSWPGQELAAQLTEPGLAQDAFSLLACPGAVTIELTSVAVRIAPDPAQGTWPDSAKKVTTTITSDGHPLRSETSPIPATSDPLVVTLALIPAGIPFEVTVTALTANGSTAGSASQTLPAAVAPPAQCSLTLTTSVAVVDDHSTFVPRRTLVYDATTKQYRWSPAGSATANNGAAAAPLMVALHQGAQTVGVVGRGDDDTSTFQVATFGTVTAMQGASTLADLATGPALAFDRLGSTADARAGTGLNFLLDCTNSVTSGRWHLRRVTLPSNGSLHFDAKTSYGAFFGPAVAMSVHPTGSVMAIDRDTGTLSMIRAAGSGVADERAPVAINMMANTGLAGSELVAITVTLDSIVIVLDQRGSRLLALDAFASPVPYFDSGTKATMELAPAAQDRAFLDITSGPNGVIYVLASTNNVTELQVWNTNGTVISTSSQPSASRIVADSLGRIYALSTDFQLTQLMAEELQS